nr:uncharacterized protein LOC121126765 [Lepeophtheirus salmonis]
MYCVAFGCKNKYAAGNSISYHRFPTQDPERCNQWIVNLGIGKKGCHSDGKVLSDSICGRSLMDGTLDFPAPKGPPNTNIKVPHVLLGEEIFPLRLNLIRPYPRKDLNEEQAVFNYRQSKARRVVENAFGILAKWLENISRRN